MTEQLAQPADVSNAWTGWNNLSEYRQTSLLNTASRKILNFCRREHFGQVGLDEFYDGRNQPRIWLNHKPVIQIATVIVNGDPLDNSQGNAWNFEPKKGALMRGWGIDALRFQPWFPMGKRNIEVVYWAGFTEIPPEITEATVQYVRYLAEQVQVSGVFSAERIGDYNYTLNATATSMTLPQHIANMCADYVQDDGPL